MTTSNSGEPQPPFSAQQHSALAHYLRTHVGQFSGLPVLKALTGGQSNPTYLVDAGGESYVLRKKPPGKLLNSAHAIEREYRILSALRDSSVPVPQVHALCEDPSIIGSPFYVMAFVQGRTFVDPSLPAVPAAQRSAIYDELNRVICRLHKLDFATYGLEDFGKPANFLERQLNRWTRQYRESETEKIPAMEHLIAWLPQNLPTTGETSIVHGDFRIDNMIFHPTEPRILAVLDWELSTLGNPLIDFAYHCMSWRVTPEEFRGLHGHDLATLGIPCEDEYVRKYCQQMEREDIPHWNYYIVFNMFRMAAILQGIWWRAKNGNASSPEAEKTGRLAIPMAQAGWRQVEHML